MAGAIELVPLVCTQCSTPVPAEPDEVAWLCRQCGQGLLLDDQKGLAGVEILFSQGLQGQKRGKPFWVADGQVSMQRESFKGDKSREAHEFWRTPRRFFIPAFTCDFKAMLALGSSLLRTPPSLQPGPPAPFDPVVLPIDDILPTAEFLVIAIEADRPDKLKEVKFKLELGVPALWVLP